MVRFRQVSSRGRVMGWLAIFLALAGTLLAPHAALGSHSGPSKVDGELDRWGHYPSLMGQVGVPSITTHLTYYGGKVISNVKIVMVVYGSGTYIPEISGTQMGSFYAGVTNSPYMDWLSEYNTTITAQGGGPGTNQTIGRGTFLGKFTITPSVANNGSTITDSQIQAELNAQITAGVLPAPDDNTLYMLHFPQGKTITLGTDASCVVFCAYHGAFKRNTQNVYYGVHPHLGAGSACNGGCGSGTIFANQCSTASHEMIEAITDAEVSFATSLGAPLAWYDNASGHGEIGDICNAQQGTVVGGDSVTYTVQKQWSNVSNACIVSRPVTIHPPGDFDGDGKSDILLRNSATGEAYLYYMGGTGGRTVLSGGFLPGAPTVWAIEGVADFDGDGKPDIVWRNTLTGDVYIYYMGGTGGRTVLSGGFAPGAPTNWVIAGVADFDGDTHPDIVWRNTLTGEIYIYYMGGAGGRSVLSGGYAPGAPTVWSIAGVTDFNGDGHPDIVWHNDSTGEIYVYYMGGTGGRSVLSGGYVPGAPTAWSIGTIVDMDGDGHPDIVWRYAATGDAYIYYLGGALGNTFLSGAVFPGAPPVWTIAGP